MYFIMAELNKKYFDIIIKYAKINCPQKRKTCYSDEYYLKLIFLVLSDFSTWRSLKYSIHYKNGELAKYVNSKENMEKIKKDNHWKTIYDKHIQWGENGVYEAAYNELISDVKKGYENKDTVKLLIDGLNVINKYGIDNIGYGGESRKKKFTNLTIISDTNKNILVVNANETNKKEVQFDNKTTKTKISTLKHDIDGVIPAVEKLNMENKNIIIGGDMGYIMNENNEKAKILEKMRKKLVTPYRKNQKKKNTEEEKELLKIRYKVENCISNLKKYNRIHVRKEKYVKNYMYFVYIALIKNNSVNNKELEIIKEISK
jgi:hypothetical protein